MPFLRVPVAPHALTLLMPRRFPGTSPGTGARGGMRGMRESEPEHESNSMQCTEGYSAEASQGDSLDEAQAHAPAGA
jgi:hypothetical protein